MSVHHNFVRGGYNRESRGGHHYSNHDGGRGSHGGRGRGGYRGRGHGVSGSSDGGGQSRFKKSYSEEVKEQVEILYNKKFKFVDEYDQWKLPDLTSWFNQNEKQPFQVEALLEIKQQLKEVKSRLDEVEIMSWLKHTSFTNRSGVVVPAVRRDYEPEMCTQGWTKMHEILWTFKNVVPESNLKLTSVHLCEIPGAFVASLNHFLGTHRMDCSWQWKAISLNPYYEGHELATLIDQDKFMSETKQHWSLGADNTGDITSWDNFRKFKAEVDEVMEGVHLVTADGSMDCSRSPGEEEGKIAHLLLCEVVAAFFLLRPSGNLVLKTFTTLEHRSICLMYLLVCCFSEVCVFKPATSKSGNSEQYVICLNFNGHSFLTPKHMEVLKQAFCSTNDSAAFFQKKVVPSSFLNQLQNCATKFAKYQVENIEENLQYYECMRASEKQFIVEVKEYATDTYKTRFKLKKLPRDKNIVPHIHLNGLLLNVMMPVQGDPTREWLERRSVDEFVHKWEEKRKEERAESLSDEGEDEDDDDLPAAKRWKVTPTEDACQAVRYLLNVIGYDGTKTIDRVGEPPLVLMEMEPEDVQWLKNTSSGDVCSNLKSKDGKLADTVKNSRFCRHDLMHRLSETLRNSPIMQSDREDEHMDIASHVTPGLALSAGDQPFYLNTDAVNYAALDHLVHFTSKFEELLFMDLVGAPSGFSHYIYWKKQHLAKGWGMVRKERPKLGPGKVMERLAPWETFQVLGPHSGVDISDSVMIKSLCAGIKNYCPDGIHLVIGDVPIVPFGAQPPFCAERDSKCYLLSQFICACKILRNGGMFICRIYDILSRFTAGLLYVMYKLFEEVTIIKPVTSCPTSAERFVVCLGYNGCKSILTQLLLDVNAHIRELRKLKEDVDVLEIVPVQQLFEEQFYRYLCYSNERIARYRIRMIIHLDIQLRNLEKLPSKEEKEMLARGILEILQIPKNPL